MATNVPIASAPPPAGVPGTNTLALEDIRDIKPPLVLSDWSWLWWLLAAGLLAAALVGWWRWRRGRPAQARIAIDPATLIPPHVRAKQRLEAALALIHAPQPFCFAVSDALRVYLEEQMDLRAPERTTEEFLVELQGSTRLDDAHKRGLADFLQRTDLVKFARHQPGEPELRELHAAAWRLVVETEPSQPPEPAADRAPQPLEPRAA